MIEEQKSPCRTCFDKRDRRVCSKTCALLKTYRSYLKEIEDPIERASTLSGIKYTILMGGDS